MGQLILRVEGAVNDVGNDVVLYFIHLSSVQFYRLLRREGEKFHAE